jgi:hypothetical protein
LIRSKRVIVLAASFVSGLAARKGLDLDAASLAILMTGVVSYILGQSIVEASKPAPTPPAE